MNHFGKICCLLMTMSLLTGGCLSLKQPAMRSDYYSPEYDPPKVSDKKMLPFVIGVDRFQVAPFYDTDKIVSRDGAFKRSANTYHRWISNPGNIVSYFLARDIKSSGLFKAVFSSDRSISPSHKITGAVDEFFEQKETDSGSAVICVSITLMAENEPDVSKRVLLQKKYSEQEICARKEPQALAEAMSKAMSRLFGKIIADIYDCLADKL